MFCTVPISLTWYLLLAEYWPLIIVIISSSWKVNVMIFWVQNRTISIDIMSSIYSSKNWVLKRSWSCISYSDAIVFFYTPESLLYVFHWYFASFRILSPTSDSYAQYVSYDNSEGTAKYILKCFLTIEEFIASLRIWWKLKDWWNWHRISITFAIVLYSYCKTCDENTSFQICW